MVAYVRAHHQIHRDSSFRMVRAGSVVAFVHEVPLILASRDLAISCAD